MSTIVLMRAYERTPEKYDLAMRLITLGRITKIREDISNSIEYGSRVLDLGCGTGALFPFLIERKALVTAIDISPKMIQFANERKLTIDEYSSITTLHRTALEIDSLFSENEFDIIVISFMLSELSFEEQKWVLNQCSKLLAPHGIVLIADEILPRNHIKKIFYYIARFPFHFYAYIHSHLETIFTLNRLKKLYYFIIELPLITLSFFSGNSLSKPIKNINDICPNSLKIVDDKYYFLSTIGFLKLKRI